MYLFIDCETEEENTKLRELCILLDDENRITIGKLHYMNSPNGLHVEFFTTANWINTAFSLTEALGHLCSQAKFVIAHGIEHDARTAVWVYNGFAHRRRPVVPWNKDCVFHCTKTLATEVCKLGHPFESGYKWPTLMEAYKHIVNPEGFKRWHTALADTIACRQVYYALLDGGLVPSYRTVPNRTVQR